MTTKVQLEVVPELMKKDPALGKELAKLEEQAKEIYERVNQQTYWDAGNGKVSLKDFLGFLATLPHRSEK